MKLGPGLSFSWKRALRVSKSVGIKVLKYSLSIIAVLSVILVSVAFAALVVKGWSVGREPTDGDTYSTGPGNLSFFVVLICTVVALVIYERKKKLKAQQKIED